MLIALPHVFIDDGRFVAVWLRQVKHSPDPAPSLRLMVDQSFHVVCLLGGGGDRGGVSAPRLHQTLTRPTGRRGIRFGPCWGCRMA